jgi:alpha-L-rhamnosidase
MLDRGATTIWEDWDGVGEDGAASASLNHYSKGAVIRFLHTHTLGLHQEPESVGWEAFAVRPVPGGSLTRARGTFESPQGVIGVEWSIEDGHLAITVDVPPGSRARIHWPHGHTAEAGPGRFHASRPLRVPLPSNS